MAKEIKSATPEEVHEEVRSSGAELTHPYTPTPTIEETKAKPAVRLRVPNPFKRLRRLPFWAYLAVLGPGVISAAAGNDAGGIATYAQAGAAYGYTLLWAMLVITF